MTQSQRVEFAIQAMTAMERTNRERGGGDYREAFEFLATLARSAVPSGQVAEDDSVLRQFINSVDSPAVLKEQHTALSRLAAGAQRAQQAEQERDEARARVSALHTASGCTSMHTAMTAEAGCAVDAILALRAEAERRERAELAELQGVQILNRNAIRLQRENVDEQRKRAEAAEKENQRLVSELGAAHGRAASVKARLTALQDGIRELIARNS